MKILIKRRELLRLMAKNFLSQKVFAEKIGITPQALNAIIKERNGTSLETAKKICELFSCDFGDLFDVVDKTKG